MTIQVQRNQSSPLEGFGNVWAGGGFSTDERLESNLTAVDRPNDAVANHCVEYRYHLTHHRHDHDLRLLSRSRKPIVESLERWIPITRAQRRHVEHIANGRATAPDTTHSLELATLEVVGRDTDERSDLRTGELAKLGQERNQAAASTAPTPGIEVSSR